MALFTRSVLSRVLFLAGVVVAVLDVFFENVDLPYEAYVAMVFAALVLGAWQWQASLPEDAEIPKAVTKPGSRRRTGVDIQGGSANFRRTRVRNHDTGFKSRDADVRSDDMDVA